MLMQGEFHVIDTAASVEFVSSSATVPITSLGVLQHKLICLQE